MLLAQRQHQDGRLFRTGKTAIVFTDADRHGSQSRLDATAGQGPPAEIFWLLEESHIIVKKKSPQAQMAWVKLEIVAANQVTGK